ncbi:peptidoglycan DD-metalloendopeptidase family protein [Paenibacillus sp.]|uniref:peptidoglycan DD-metalloendopeptidase family protein n=1 Tax=Paenibacillus sp. TaxID=58172 RepID=UPI002D2BC734|nr:peptidoglycan DD-metalloendopeptidase family protein [Paenibacillus sp.]HZG57302.1 peptidoglycan DD-metalloendopeptidase family protein [Paenibacillus sp.]
MTQFRGRLPFERASEKLKDALLNFKSKGLYTKLKWRTKDGYRDTKQWLYTYKIHVAGTVGAAVFVVSLAYAGNAYVSANMQDVYEVYVDDTRIGEVSSPDVVKWAIVEELEEMQRLHPEVSWEVDADGVRLEKETVFKGEAEDPETAEALKAAIEAKAVGVEVVVNGKAVAVVKDEATANRILERVKETFSSVEAPDGLTVLSAEPVSSRDDDVIAEGTPELLSTRIVEPVELLKREIQPNDVMDEQEVLDMLIQGDTKPTQYIVQEGDTPGGIAQKLGVPIELIYSKNQDNKDLVERDLIRPGDVLDLTMLQPAVTIESVERVTETIAVQYETIYEEDASMRKGQSKTIREGRKGVKEITYVLTKVNGLLMDEKVTDEVIVEEPIPAVVKRGTKVVLGEGTGKFVWPVASANVSSNYGKRWGRQHKGIDITSKNKTIMASDTGKVTFAGWKSDYGNVVIIDHKNGYETLYAHLSKISVKKGDIVEKGDKIGVMGSTGRSTGVHLHFEIIVNGVEKNPRSYLSK